MEAFSLESAFDTTQQSNQRSQGSCLAAIRLILVEANGHANRRGLASVWREIEPQSPKGIPIAMPLR